MAPTEGGRSAEVLLAKFRDSVLLGLGLVNLHRWGLFLLLHRLLLIAHEGGLLHRIAL